MPTTEKRQDASVRDLLEVIFRRKFIIVSIVILTTLTVIYLNATQPQTYVSSARLLIRRGERQNVFTGTMRYLSWQEEMSSQIEMVLSEAVFSRAREVFVDSAMARGVDPMMVQFNPGAVRANVVGESAAFTVVYSGLDPVECELGCLAMTEAYKDYFRQRTAPPEVNDYFASELDDVRTELEHWRTRKHAFLSQEQFFGLDDESRFQLNKLGQLEMRLSSLGADIVTQRLNVEKLAVLVELSPSELESEVSVSTSRAVLQSGIISNIKFRLQDLKIKREDLIRKYTEVHPEVVSVDNQIRELRLELKNQVDNMYDVESTYLRQIEAEKTQIEMEVASIQEIMAELPDKEMKLSRIEAKISELEDRHEMLIKKQNEAEITRESSPEMQVTVLSPPSRATPRRTRDYVRLSLGPVLSLVVGLGLAFFLESMDHSIKKVAEVEEYLDSRVLATFTDFRDRD